MKLLKNGFIVNMETGEFSRQDIYIENNEIIKIAPNIQMDDVEAIDCTNKWLIPGLIDMHVHIKNTLPITSQQQVLQRFAILQEALLNLNHLSMRTGVK